MYLKVYTNLCKLQEKAANASLLSGSTIRWVMSPTGTVVTFPNELGLPKMFDPPPCRYVFAFIWFLCIQWNWTLVLLIAFAEIGVFHWLTDWLYTTVTLPLVRTVRVHLALTRTSIEIQRRTFPSAVSSVTGQFNRRQCLRGVGVYVDDDLKSQISSFSFALLLLTNKLCLVFCVSELSCKVFPPSVVLMKSEILVFSRSQGCVVDELIRKGQQIQQLIE